MQLFTPLGFRYVNCTGCATQRWARGWLCECGVSWHTCPIHRRDPGVHRSTKPPKKKIQGKVESCFKDSERRAPEAVQSTTSRPLKKIKVNKVMHAHGGEAESEVASKLRRMNLIEKWRMRSAGKQLMLCDEIKQDDTAIDEDEDAKKARACFFSQIVQAPRGLKRQAQEMARDGVTTRRRLQEVLNEQVVELRRKQVRKADAMIQQKVQPSNEQAEPKEFKVHGNDAIARLINVGRRELRSSID